MGDSAEAATVCLDVFSDYTCPWCYVGWARLQQALRDLPDHIEVEVRWRPFEIHREVPPEGMPVEDLHYSPEQWAQMQQALAQAAAAEGLEVGNRPKVSNTHEALAASEYVWHEERPRFAAFHEALFTVYFAVGRDLGDPAVLRDVAVSVGVDAGAMRAALDDGRYENVLEATSREARELGIRSTPTFLFDGRFVAAGAQPTDVLLRALTMVADESSEA